MHMEAFTYEHIAQQAERMSAIEEKVDCMTQFCPQRYSKIDNSSAHNLTYTEVNKETASHHLLLKTGMSWNE